MKKLYLLIIIAIVTLISACSSQDEPESIRISGETMGTTYNISVNGESIKLSSEELRAKMESVFQDVNSKMSNWDKKSEVTLFSMSKEITPIKVSKDFVTVLKAANHVHEKSGGKFDVTLGPLIQLWGFGPRKPEDPVPSQEQIADALSLVGQASLLKLDESALTVSKNRPEVGVNLSAIAKGFGIDAAARKLAELGFENYMVEIGGDLRASGTNEKGEGWRIGIEKPEPGAETIEIIVPIVNAGMATSGDYRNFVEYGGVRYSHIIDPGNGYPITHRTTSVSVITENAMMADAWATALLAIGAEEGISVAEENGLAVYFISRKPNTSSGANSEEYEIKMSSAFEELLN